MSNGIKLEMFVIKRLVSLFYWHLKMYNNSSFWRKCNRQASSASSVLNFSQGNFANWKHNVNEFWSYLKAVWKFFCQESIKQFLLLSQYIFSFFTKGTSNFWQVIHGFRDSVLVRKLHTCGWDMQKFRAQKQ